MPAVNRSGFRSGIGLIVLALCACGGGGSSSGDAASTEPQRVELAASAGQAGDLVYLPFEVPEGVNRIEARFLDGTTDSIGLGVFDARGTEFLGPGFRGIAGEERREFFIAADEATPGFIAGPFPPGQWNLVVPNYLTRGEIIAEVTMYFGELSRTPSPQPVPEQLRAEGGWYRGDLHVHTAHSSDAFNSGNSLTPAEMALRAQQLGLDFIAVTDHNVSTQNDHLQADAPEDFLLLAGGEITTWLAGPGHLIVAGLQSQEFVDWRFRPVDGIWAKPQSTWGEDEHPIQTVLDYARAQGFYTSAAHPFVAPGFGSNWGFFTDSDQDMAALPDGLEVWNDDFFISGGTATLARWDTELARGRRLCGNGGSDVHGVGGDIEVGTPTTVVYAKTLSRAGIVEALKACRGYVTSGPDGPGLLLSATGPGEQTVMMGDALIGGAGDRATFSVRVIGGAGARLILTRGGLSVFSRAVDSDDQSFTTELSLGNGGAVRAELWPNALSAPFGFSPMALSNPVFYGTETPQPLREALSDGEREQAIARFPAAAQGQ